MKRWIEMLWIRFQLWRRVPHDWRGNPDCSCVFCQDWHSLTARLDALSKGRTDR